MTKRTKIVLATSIPTVIAAGFALWFLVFMPKDVGASTAQTATEIIEVEALTAQEGIEISGNIEPTNSADLAFPIAGYIDAIYVDVGDTVETGTVLAVLEDSQQRYDLASVEMEIDTENVTGTKRNLDLLELKLEMTQASLDDTRLSSTISGLITSVDAEIGDYVTAQTAGASADVVVRVIDRSSMVATVEVDELDAPYLKEGQKVEFQFDAYPDLEVIGEVSLVPLEARTTSQGIAVLDAEVIINDPPEEILPYFTFAGEIFLEDEEAILLLPEDAVIARGDRSMVLAVMSIDDAEAARTQGSGAMGGNAAGGTGISGAGRPSGTGGPPGADISLPEGFVAVPVPVTVKSYGSGKVQVLTGLQEGDKVAVTTTATDGASAPMTGEDDEGSANVLEMLGMDRGPGSGGGPPPGQP